MLANPFCIGVIPYENVGKDTLTMCVYVDSDGNGIPQDIQDAAKEMFADYVIDWIDLQQRPPCKIVSELPSSKKQKGKELSDLSRTIEKNLHVFDKRLNVTAVCASYKVTDFREKDTLCVTVFVMGKGRVPAGETDIELEEKLNHHQFDVVEGYYKPTRKPSSSDMMAHAFPLRGGVGIGVKGLPGAGTLGGFLEDEEGNCYILSNEHVLRPCEVKNNPPNDTSDAKVKDCTNDVVHGAGTSGGLSGDVEGNSTNRSNQHVLHPPEVGNNTNVVELDNSTNKFNIIVQPSQSDYEKMLQDAKCTLDNCMETKSNFENPKPERGPKQEKNSEYFNDMRRMYDNKITQAKNVLFEIQEGKPREIGKYVYGLQGNVKLDDLEVYVDAAIAELNEKQVQFMKGYKCSESKANHCPAYGFENIQDFSPNGETIDLENFHQELRMKESERFFVKIGRGTGFTDGGFIDTSMKELFVKMLPAPENKIPAPENKIPAPENKIPAPENKIPAPENKIPVPEPGATASFHIPLPFCENCIQSFASEKENIDQQENFELSKNCMKCDKRIGKKDGEKKNDDVEDHARFFWARNCVVIRKHKESFCKPGDSGALVFGKDNRAWGLLFGTYDVGIKNSDYCLASPLSAVLKALEQKTGKKGLKLW